MPNYVNGYAVQSSAYMLPFDARGAADTIKVPVLIVHSDKRWIDFYDDPQLIAPASDAVAAFCGAARVGGL